MRINGHDTQAVSCLEQIQDKPSDPHRTQQPTCPSEVDICLPSLWTSATSHRLFGPHSPLPHSTTTRRIMTAKSTVKTIAHARSYSLSISPHPNPLPCSIPKNKTRRGYPDIESKSGSPIIPPTTPATAATEPCSSRRKFNPRLSLPSDHLPPPFHPPFSISINTIPLQHCTNPACATPTVPVFTPLPPHSL